MDVLFLRWLNFKLGLQFAVLIAMLIVAVVLTCYRMAEAQKSFIQHQSREIRTLNQDSRVARSHRW